MFYNYITMHGEKKMKSKIKH